MFAEQGLQQVFEWGAKEEFVRKFLGGWGGHACGFLFNFSKVTENAIIHLIPKWRRPRMVWVELHKNKASRAMGHKRFHEATLCLVWSFMFVGGQHSWQFTHWKRCESIEEF